MNNSSKGKKRKKLKLTKLMFWQTMLFYWKYIMISDVLKITICMFL